MTAPDYYVVSRDNPIHTLPTRVGGAVGAPLSWQQLQATVTFFVDSFVGQVAIAFGGIEILGWKPFEFLVDWGQDRIDDATRNYLLAMNAQGTANYAITQIGASAASTFAGAVAGGVALTANFNGSASSNLGGSFTRSSFGSGGGGYGPNGSGWAVWTKVGGLSRTHFDRHNTTLATDYQVVIVVMTQVPQTPSFGGTAYNYLFGRVNAALTDVVYARISHNDLALGCWVGGIATSFGSTSFTPAVGDEIRLYIGTSTDVREFVVTRNSSEILRYTDSSAVSQYGASNLYAGLGATAADRSSFFDQTVPGSLDSWAAADRLATAF